MNERLWRTDLALLSMESRAAPLHSASVAVLDPLDSGLDYDRLLDLVEDRLDFVPRYRQRVRRVPGRLAAPVWVDDDDFDLAYHVRRSAVPSPGTLDQLAELTERIIARRLDPERPLWEVYLIEGLEDGRVALLVKSHQALVDGTTTLDLGQVLLDVEPESEALEAVDWQPQGLPSDGRLVLDALGETLHSPRTLVRTVRGNAFSVVSTAAKVGGRLTGVHHGSALPGRRSASEAAFHAASTGQRRVQWVATPLKDHRKVRRAHGGTVNDVVLATVTGGLRSWLMTRGVALGTGRRVRALLPMGVVDEALEPTSLGTQVIGNLVNLPVGERSPVVRLHQVSYALREHKDTGRAVSAERIAATDGFAPATFHALAARMATVDAEASYDVVVTNVPGPQFPMYVGGAEAMACYPVPALQRAHTLAIGVTSYQGQVYYGITAERDRVPDADLLAQCIRDALDELVESAGPTRDRAARGRRNGRKDPAKAPEPTS